MKCDDDIGYETPEPYMPLEPCSRQADCGCDRCVDDRANLPPLTLEAQRLLWHALGLVEGEEARGSYREHLVTGPSMSAELVELVDHGLVCEARRPGFLPTDARSWRVTLRGKLQGVTTHRAALPKLSRGQRRYREWLRVMDAYNISFGDWLRMNKKNPRLT